MAAPAAFEKNEGQIMTTEQEPATDVLFRVQLADWEVFFLKDRISYVFREHPESQTQKDPQNDRPPTQVYRYDMTFEGGNSEVALIGKGEKDQKQKYYKAESFFEPEFFEKLSYKELYPGVDLIFYLTEEGQLKYDFVVVPGVTPDIVKFSYLGDESLEVTLKEEGALAISHPLGEIREAKPVSYCSGEEVSTSFVKKEGFWGFELSDYDAGETLVVDPEVAYSSYLGGSSNEYFNAMDGAVNTSTANYRNNHYVSGSTQSSDYPYTVGLQQYIAQTDAIVSRFNESGSLLWSTHLGGNEVDISEGVVILENTWKVAITGYTYSDNLPSALNSYASNGDAFVAFFDSDGSLDWVRYLGGSDIDEGYGIARLGLNEIGVVGNTYSNDFPLSLAFQSTPPSSFSGFVTVLDFSGSIQRSSYYAEEVQLKSIAARDGSHFIVGGNAYGSSGMPGTALNTHSAQSDFLISRVHTDFSAVDWHYFIGGVAFDDFRGMYYAGSNDIHLVGHTLSSNIPVTPFSNAHQDNLTTTGGGGYYARLSQNASSCNLEYGTYLYGSGSTAETKLNNVFESGGKVYVVGFTSSIFDIDPSTEPISANFPQNAMKSGIVGIFDESSGNLDWLSYYGADADVRSVSYGNNDKLYLSGNAEGYIPITSDAEQGLRKGGLDGFISILSFDPICEDVPYDDYFVEDFPSHISNLSFGYYRFEGAVYINQDLTIEDAELHFGACSELIIQSGVEVTLLNVNLKGCGRWKGIRVMTGGRLDFDGSDLRGAEVGIIYESQSFGSIDGSTFSQNYYHVGLLNNTTDFSIKSTNFFRLDRIRTQCFYDNGVGDGRSFYLDFNKPDKQKMLYVESGSTSLEVSNCNFNNNSFDVYDIDGLHFYNSSKTMDISGNNFENQFKHGIYIDGVSGYGEITANTFSTNLSTYSALVENCAEIDFLNNQINNKGEKEFDGLLLKNNFWNVVHDNIFTSCRYGLVYLDDQSYQHGSEIKWNYFTFSEIGLVIAPTHNPLHNPSGFQASTTTELVWRCNDFLHNEAGVIGSGNIVDQTPTDPIIHPPQGASTGNTYDNTNVDILWHTSYSFNYNVTTSVSVVALSQYILDNLPFDDNSMLGQGVNLITVFNMKDCSQPPLMILSTEETKDGNDLEVYPNPFQDVLHFRAEKEGVFFLQVFDISGKLHYSQQIGNQEELSTAHWKAGVYLLKLSSRADDFVTHKKLIKY